ncbi:hypothetical protein GGG16DRAFT_108459 [Schizophyllum commune]
MEGNNWEYRKNQAHFKREFSSSYPAMPPQKGRVDHIEGCVVSFDTPFVSGEDNEIKDSSSSTTYTKDTSGLIQTSVCGPIRELGGEHAATADAERKALQLRRAVVYHGRELLTKLTMRKEKEDLSRRAELTLKAREARAKEEVER